MQQSIHRTPALALAALVVLIAAAPAHAMPAPQDGRPQTAPPTSQAGDAGNDAATTQDPDGILEETALTGQDPGDQDAVDAANPPAGAGELVRDRPQRSPDEVGPVRRDVVGNIYLNFNDISVPETFPWLVEITGKVVIPVNLPTLNAKKFSLMTDNALPKNEALDLMFRAFRLNGIGIIELDDILIVGDINAGLGDLVGEIPVIGPDESVMDRQDLGTIVIKIFKLEKAPAQNVGDHLAEFWPDTYATLAIDPNSNQIVILGDLALARTCETIVKMLDQEWVKGRLRTFHLRYADASLVADNVFELFESSGTGQQSNNQRGNRGNDPRQNQGRGGGGPTPGETTPGLEVELRVTVNTQQNAVTVFAEPSVIDEITRLIETVWDIPRAPETSKVYQLQHTDPIQIRDLLNNVLGSDTGSAGGGGAARAARGGQGGQQTTVADSLSGIYRFEAFTEANSLVVVVKTKESLDFLDNIIMQLDQPSTVGLPVVVPLKYADSVELANELNALLAEPGQQVNIDAPERGLTGEGLGSISDDAQDGGQQQTQQGGGQQSTAIQFPWQRGRATDDRAPESSLIGRVRIVPIVRQNALAILAPIAQREAVRELVNTFDSPGRQVMIKAIIAEVELSDDFALGLRVSPSELSLSNVDNAIGGSVIGSATEDLNLFDTAALDIGITANVVLQALAEKTNVRIIQEPRVFTADNQEAYFFDGQDVPFITNSNVTDLGGITQSFNYRPVGVVLNVRPHITSKKDIDMEINLELSTIVAGQTLFGGFIVDRRETTTKIVIENGQTIVLSGILRDQTSEIERRVPLLGDLPIIGPLFRSVENSTTTTELVAFITPMVVDHPSENDTNFMQDERERVRRLMGEINKNTHEESRKDMFDRIEETTKYRQQQQEQGDADDGAIDDQMTDDNNDE